LWLWMWWRYDGSCGGRRRGWRSIGGAFELGGGRNLAFALEQLSKRFVFCLKVFERVFVADDLGICVPADDLALDLDHSAEVR
jgi:hypothetical protein